MRSYELTVLIYILWAEARSCTHLFHLEGILLDSCVSLILLLKVPAAMHHKSTKSKFWRNISSYTLSQKHTTDRLHAISSRIFFQMMKNRIQEWFEHPWNQKFLGCCFPSKIKHLWCCKPPEPLVAKKTCSLHEILTQLVITENIWKRCFQ